MTVYNIPSPNKHLFTNILRCADCKKGMWYRSNRRGYICGSYAKHGNKACSSHAIKEVFVKEQILSDIQSLFEQINEKDFVKKLEESSKKSKSHIQQQLNKFAKKIDELRTRKRKYINMLADEQLTHEEYRDIVEANNIEIKELELKKSDLLSALENEKAINNLSQLKEELQKFLSTDNLTTAMLQQIIDHIEVNEGGSILIHYRFSVPTIN